MSDHRQWRSRLASDGDDPDDDERPGSDAKDVEDLGRRLSRARSKAGLNVEPEQEPIRVSGVGVGLRIATELVVALVVGGAIGWFLDSWLNTRPLLLILFLFFGFGAGVLNIIRSTAQADNGQT